MTEANHPCAIALVTGASRGLGRAAALELAQRKTHLVAVARSQGALEELDDKIRQVGGTATLVPLDLADRNGIARLAVNVAKRWGRLDLLLHAAVRSVPLAPVPSIDPEQLRAVLTINAETAQSLIATFDGLLRKTPGSRAIFVDDPKGIGAFHGAYAASKAAMAAIVEAYAAEMRRHDAPQIFRVLPPPMATASRRRTRPGEPSLRLARPEQIASKLMETVFRATSGKTIDLREHGD